MRIVVLAGGLSMERNVSLSSGNKICRALRSLGHQAILVDMFIETAVIVLKAHEHIHQNGLVAPLAQGAAHAGAAGQRYLPLGAEAAGQHYDFHIQSLISHGGTRPRNAIISI